MSVIDQSSSSTMTPGDKERSGDRISTPYQNKIKGASEGAGLGLAFGSTSMSLPIPGKAKFAITTATTAIGGVLGAAHEDYKWDQEVAQNRKIANAAKVIVEGAKIDMDKSIQRNNEQLLDKMSKMLEETKMKPKSIEVKISGMTEDFENEFASHMATSIDSGKPITRESIITAFRESAAKSQRSSEITELFRYKFVFFLELLFLTKCNNNTIELVYK